MTNETIPQEPESVRAKKSRLEIARKKALEANALLEKLEAQARERASENGRKLDDRRKILLGAYLLRRMRRDEDEKARVLAGLDKYLHRASERALFGLPPLAPKPEPVVQEQAPALSAGTGENAPQAQSAHSAHSGV